MSTSSRLVMAALAVSLIAGCASNDPYQTQDSQSGGVSNTAKYGGLGALAGAAAGALIKDDDRGSGALIGAAVGGAAGAGYGYYADKQEEQLRAQMAGTGVEVQRQGDNITLVMPGNITFASDSADIAASFYAPLNNLASSFQQYDQNSIEIIGHTDSTGGYQYNVALSQRRAQSVANYLMAQGVNATRLSTSGVGPDQPVASNSTPTGRAQNRRVEINLRPLPSANTGATGTTGGTY